MRAFIGAPAGALVRARGRGALCVRRRAAVRAAAPPVAAKNGAAEGVPTPSNGEDPTPAPGSGIDPLGADEGDLASMPKEELKSAYGIAKFDPDSELNAFGRDPRQETEFWMGSAKEVLDMPEVREAIDEHAKDPSAGVDAEKEAYLEFIRSLDEKKKDKE